MLNFLILVTALATFLFLEKEGLYALLISSFILSLILATKITPKNIMRRIFYIEPGFIYVVIVMGWIFLCLFASLPIYFSEKNISLHMALFESFSGITTTGATIIALPEKLPRGILLWRSMIQWIGGLGMITMILFFLQVFHLKRIAFFYHFKEFSTEKNIQALAKRIFFFYISITLSCCITYTLFGMPLFDAICHAMTTVSTGGFSTHSQSLGYFQECYSDIIAVPYMIIGSAPFILFTSDKKRINQKEKNQMFILLSAIIIFSAIILLANNFLDNHYSPQIEERILRHVLFLVTTSITGTGLVTHDYTMWHSSIIGYMTIMLLIGGCSYSTACSIKIMRYKALWIDMKKTIKKFLTIPQIETDKNIMNRITCSYLVLFLTSLILGHILLIACQNSEKLSFFLSLSMITNFGPGLIHEIGPFHSYEGLNTPTLYVMMFIMLVGRIEINTFIVLLFIVFKRRDTSFSSNTRE